MAISTGGVDSRLKSPPPANIGEKVAQWQRPAGGLDFYYLTAGSARKKDAIFEVDPIPKVSLGTP